MCTDGGGHSDGVGVGHPLGKGPIQTGIAATVCTATLSTTEIQRTVNVSTTEIQRTVNVKLYITRGANK